MVRTIGYVQSFLSWKFFMPLGRLSYAVYLIHPVYSSMRKPLYSTESSFFTTYFGILTMAFLIASIVSVVFEMPFLNLDKLLIPENSCTPSNSPAKSMYFSISHKSKWHNQQLIASFSRKTRCPSGAKEEEMNK